MKKLLTLALALTLLLTFAAPAFAVPDDRAAVEAMEHFMAGDGKTKQTEDLGIEYYDNLWGFHYIDLDRDGIPELVRSYMRGALQCSMDVLAAKKTGAGFAVEKVASFVDDGYHLFGGGTDRIYRLGRFADGTYGVSCFMPEYAAENDGETVSESYAYYAYRDGAFAPTAENGFEEIDVFSVGPFTYYKLGDYGAHVSTQRLIVDGEEIVCEKYHILGSNYFKLRDLAAVLNGTPAQFSVGWDDTAKAVSIVPGESYERGDGDLVIGEDRSASAVPSSHTVAIDGFVRGDLTVFNMRNNNFFKLPDLGKILGFTVDYDPAANAAVVTTAAG